MWPHLLGPEPKPSPGAAGSMWGSCLEPEPVWMSPQTPRESVYLHSPLHVMSIPHRLLSHLSVHPPSPSSRQFPSTSRLAHTGAISCLGSLWLVPMPLPEPSRPIHHLEQWPSAPAQRHYVRHFHHYLYILTTPPLFMRRKLRKAQIDQAPETKCGTRTSALSRWLCAQGPGSAVLPALSLGKSCFYGRPHSRPQEQGPCAWAFPLPLSQEGL